MDLYLAFISCCRANLQVMTMAICGFILGSYPVSDPIVSKDFIKKFSCLVLDVFLPCLSFHAVASRFTITHLKIVWPLLVWSTVQCSCAFLLSYSLFHIMTPFLTEKDGIGGYKRSTVYKMLPTVLAFQNTSSFPLIISETICESTTDSEACFGEAAIYLFTYSIPWSLMFWLVGYKHLKTINDCTFYKNPDKGTGPVDGMGFLLRNLSQWRNSTLSWLSIKQKKPLCYGDESNSKEQFDQESQVLLIHHDSATPDHSGDRHVINQASISVPCNLEPARNLSSEAKNNPPEYISNEDKPDCTSSLSDSRFSMNGASSDFNGEECEHCEKPNLVEDRCTPLKEKAIIKPAKVGFQIPVFGCRRAAAFIWNIVWNKWFYTEAIIKRIYAIFGNAVLGVMAGIIVGMLPSVQRLFFDSTSLFYSVPKTIHMIGQPAVPSMTIILAASLAHNLQDFKAYKSPHTKNSSDQDGAPSFPSKNIDKSSMIHESSEATYGSAQQQGKSLNHKEKAHGTDTTEKLQCTIDEDKSLPSVSPKIGVHEFQSDKYLTNEPQTVLSPGHNIVALIGGGVKCHTQESIQGNIDLDSLRNPPTGGVICLSVLLKTFLIPMVGVGIITNYLTIFGQNTSLLPKIPLLRFVILMEFAVPSSQTIVIACQRLGMQRAAGHLAYIYLWMYMCSFVTCTAFCFYAAVLFLS